MGKYITSFVCAAIIFGAMDAVWLSWAGPNLYEPNIGEILAEDFRVAPAAAFYVFYLLGMTYFAIRPGLQSESVKVAAINGALLGGLCYATFDLTSQAVMRVWATHVTLLDITWGAVATGTTSALATAIALRIAR